MQSRLILLFQLIEELTTEEVRSEREFVYPPGHVFIAEYREPMLGADHEPRWSCMPVPPLPDCSGGGVVLDHARVKQLGRFVGEFGTRDQIEVVDPTRYDWTHSNVMKAAEAAAAASLEQQRERDRRALRTRRR